MDLTFMFQLMLTVSFMIVSLALAGKLIIEAYLYWVQVKTGIEIVQDELEQQMEEEDEER